MRLETRRLVIRDLERKDEEQLQRIVWQRNIVRFMKDWSENSSVSGRLRDYIDWHQTQRDSTDVYENKRYAITLKENDLFIGIVGMGLEDTLNEVEMAYFIDENYQRKGYATEALLALFDWCMSVSNLEYMILTMIANQENITISDEEYAEELAKAVEEAGATSAEELEEAYGGKEVLKENFLFNKIIEYVADAAVEV